MSNDYFHFGFAENLIKKRERVFCKSITGENVQLSYIRLDKGKTTFHSHPNEQMGFVIKGKIELTIGGETKTLKSGDGYRIPGNLKHGFKLVVTEQNLLKYLVL